jgi:hypothetical protein
VLAYFWNEKCEIYIFRHLSCGRIYIFSELKRDSYVFQVLFICIDVQKRASFLAQAPVADRKAEARENPTPAAPGASHGPSSSHYALGKLVPGCSHYAPESDGDSGARSCAKRTLSSRLQHYCRGRVCCRLFPSEHTIEIRRNEDWMVVA